MSRSNLLQFLEPHSAFSAKNIEYMKKNICHGFSCLMNSSKHPPPP